jgi:Matrixin
MQRRMEELDRLDREFGLGTLPFPRAARSRRRRTSGPVLPSLLVTALLMGGIIALSPSENLRALRRLAGFDDQRVGFVPELVDGSGGYKFTRTQPGSDEPVAYDPCRAIEVVVNPQGAPANYDNLVDTALAHTSGATGLRFERIGLTDNRDLNRPSLGGERSPVLVSWATAGEVPELAGDVAGLGGSLAADPGTGRLRYVTGKVTLDADTFRKFGVAEAPFAQAIVDHEFGHLVGLTHVDDPHELMYKDNVGVTTYGPGDREGLARLGRVDC